MTSLPFLPRSLVTTTLCLQVEAEAEAEQEEEERAKIRRQRSRQEGTVGGRGGERETRGGMVERESGDIRNVFRKQNCPE